MFDGGMSAAIPTSTALPPVLDADQLRRIEGVHRGFFYQHLYAVGILLLLRHLQRGQVVVERDEDIEIRLSDAHRYIQVKTRSSSLVMSDITDAIERFDQIRAEHMAGRRPLTPAFVIITNATLGPELAKAVRADSWPRDVLVWSAESAGAPGEYLPPAWRSVQEALGWCVVTAEAVAFSRLAAPTMVLKLAALVQLAALGGAAGTLEHGFTLAELPTLLEQVVRELQQFPQPPVPYHSHEDEPALIGAPIRVIVGPSGAGKTAWAAHAASAGSNAASYFDAYDTPTNALAPALARELAARYFGGDADRLAATLLPGASGVEALRAVDVELQRRSIDAVVVVDNVHRLKAEEIRRSMEATPGVRWIALAQPSPNTTELIARLGVAAEPLAGWSRATINAVLADADCPAEPQTAERIRTLTGGLPLFVGSLAQLAKSRYGGDVSRLCDDLEAGTHPAHVAQEILLAHVADALSDDARRIAAMLCLLRMALSAAELVELAGASNLASPHAVGAGIRELVAWGIVRSAPEDQLRLHEAFRLLCGRFSAAIEPATGSTLRRALVDRIDPRRPGNGPLPFERAGPYLLLLVDIGELAAVVNIAANDSEALVEFGLAPLVYKVLTDALETTALSSEDRFWALDALVFWDSRQDPAVNVRRISAMEALAAEHDLGPRAQMSLQMKRLVTASVRGNVDVAKEALERIRAFGPTAADTLSARYNYALALLTAKRWQEAEDEVADVAMGFFDLLGLDPASVVAVNPPEIWDKLGGDTPERQDLLKRLADALHVHAEARVARGMHPRLARLHAFKFYVMSNSYRSAMNTGIEVVQDYLYIMRSPEEARNFIENYLLPTLEHMGLLEHIVPLRALYAVVLAKDGAIDQARGLLEELRQFVTPFDTTHQELIEHRAREVERTATERRRTLRPPDAVLPQVGRNELCPCGSGKKFKKCHGR